MIINSNITPFVVLNTSILGDVLERISLNKKGVVFVITDTGILEGVLTDGDVRNWLKNTPKWDISQSASNICNRHFVSRSENTPSSELEKAFSDQIRFIPLTDRLGRLVSIAFNELNSFSIGSFIISETNPSFIIAEIGNNHNGSLELAKKLIDEAVLAGADCAKFQMRNLGVTYRQDAEKSADEDLGTEYTLDLLTRFQLSNEELFEAFDYCKEKGILPLCTPFDQPSLAELERYGMPAYKLASADLTNHDLIRKMCETHKPLICSTGMSTESEIVDAVQLIKSLGASFALMHCNSTYPAPFKDINLNYLTRLKEIGNCEIGYSGHERNYSVPIAAVAKGARIIEKHFTLDRGMEGNDHRVSLLPNEFAGMVTSIREVEQALGSMETRRITQGEMMNRETLAKSLIATKPITKGTVIIDSYLDVRSPGKGLSPYLRDKLVGKVISRDLKAGDFFFPSDIEDSKTEPRPYNFKRPFGIPVRYHDFKQILGKSNFDLLEFHLSYKDLELSPEDFLDKDGYDLDFVVHSPELFANDHIMDLCSPNPVYRDRSIAELKRVVDITLLLKPYFKKAYRPKIIVNAGGYSLDKLIPLAEREGKYLLIAEAFNSLKLDEVEIIPQTMPPFPWHFGGQRFHNLFMTADDIVQFCEKNGMRICLDISHSKLVCNKEHKSFKEFLESVGKYSAHIHMVDAEGVDGEGLQIHEGDIDFSMVGPILDKYCPQASFIPEVWQGHKNDCEGFWIALERLEKYL